ncbi:MAG: LPS export ABC transporter periplasmic protein LptC [Elusimicrobia bacterium]|nr:LPS export ABC transporter periplasmic protein LptC [Elusimicrobiota bacterium]
MTKFFIFLFHFMVYCGISFAYDLPLSTAPHKVEFLSDEAYFFDDNKTIVLKGRVKLDEIEDKNILVRTITAKELNVNLSSKTIVAPYDIIIDQNGTVIRGESGRINYAKNEGNINNGRIDAKNIIFRGKSIKFGTGRFVYKKASLTTCDRYPPHYEIKASMLDLIPGKRFVAYNTFFYLGKIPIFYFPVLYKPLGKGTPFVSSFFPGYDKRNGIYLKSDYMYRFGRYTKGKLFLDYFSGKGFGIGGEYDYHNRAKNISNLSVYRIKEYGSSNDRLGLNGGYWHLLNSGNSGVSYYSQSFFKWLSDPNFNNDFFRSNPFAVSPDKQANIAFTRQTGRSITRVSAESVYERNTVSNSFQKNYESAPKINFNTMPIKFQRLPFLHSFTANFESSKESGVSYYQEKGNVNWTVSNNFRLSERFTFYPSVFFDEGVFLSTASASDSWIGRYGTNLNMRYDRIFGSFDLKYAYKRRLQNNKFKNDNLSLDSGEEIKTLGYEIFIRPNYNMYFRSEADYDLRDYFSKSALRRISPITAEFYFTGKKLFSFYAQNTYSPSAGNQSIVSQINMGTDQNYIGFGLANYKTSKDTYIFNNTIGFKPANSSWRIESVFRYQLAKKSGLLLKDISFFERTFILYKDFHDFRTMWKFTRRPDVNEFFFLVNLKINSKTEEAADKSDAYWYPWRKNKEIRD